MNTLHQPPLSITNPTSSSSWQYQRSQHLHHPTTIKTLVTLSSTSTSTSWALHAQAKGFGSEPSNNNNTLKKDNKKAPKTGGNEEKEEDEDDKIPQVVFDRMIRRILGYVGVPMAAGFLLLQMFQLLKENHLLDVPRWVPFLTTFLTFGSSVLGVAYGSLSTSWDGEKEGSLLGFEQVKQNWNDMWEEEDNTPKT